MSGSIRISKQHGVNPCIPLCYFCNEPKNELILMGELKGDREAPRNTVFDDYPCDKCEGYMKRGVILISVSNNAEEDDKRDRVAYEREKSHYLSMRYGNKPFRPYLQNPHRTGGWVLVSEQYITRVMQPQELVDHLLKCRTAFILDEVWDKLGLPRGAAKEKTNVY